MHVPFFNSIQHHYVGLGLNSITDPLCGIYFPFLLEPTCSILKNGNQILFLHMNFFFSNSHPG